MKRKLITLLTILTTVASTVPTYAYYKVGDAYADGVLSANDSAVILQKVLNGSYRPDAESWFHNPIYIMDVDNDNAITASDSAAVLQRVLTERYKIDKYTVDSRWLSIEQDETLELPKDGMTILDDVIPLNGSARTYLDFSDKRIHCNGPICIDKESFSNLNNSYDHGTAMSLISLYFSDLDKTFEKNYSTISKYYDFSGEFTKDSYKLLLQTYGDFCSQLFSTLAEYVSTSNITSSDDLIYDNVYNLYSKSLVQMRQLSCALQNEQELKTLYNNIQSGDNSIKLSEDNYLNSMYMMENYGEVTEENIVDYIITYYQVSFAFYRYGDLFK